MEEARKQCFKCGAEKPLTDFYKHPQMADGHVNKCKECNKKDVRENRKDKSAYYRKYDIDRGHRLPDGYIKKYETNYPERKRAVCAVNNALRSSKIEKMPCCTWCGNEFRVVAHHSHYGMPLVVTWLCQGCHVQLHKDFDRHLKGEAVDYSWAEKAFSSRPSL